MLNIIIKNKLRVLWIVSTTCVEHRASGVCGRIKVQNWGCGQILGLKLSQEDINVLS